jgi:hypothetical protein
LKRLSAFIDCFFLRPKNREAATGSLASILTRRGDLLMNEAGMGGGLIYKSGKLAHATRG